MPKQTQTGLHAHLVVALVDLRPVVQQVVHLAAGGYQGATVSGMKPPCLHQAWLHQAASADVRGATLLCPHARRPLPSCCGNVDSASLSIPQTS